MDKECAGCEHAGMTKTGYCYMFDKKPETVPCAQHTKYKAQRQQTARAIRKNPMLLSTMLPPDLL